MNAKRRFRILVVDDVPENIQVLAEALSAEHQVLVATDGRRALEIARRAEAPLDLILLDIMMPGMDGFEVCRRLKDDPLTAQLPVIFVTAKDSPDDEFQGLSLGAVDYVTKPFQLPVVQARVANLLARRAAEEERLAVERQLAQARQKEALGVMAGGMAHDFNNLLMVISGNLELMGMQLAGQHREPIEHAVEACRKAAALVKQMLHYAGKSHFGLLVEVDVGQVLEECLNILTPGLSPAASLTFADPMPLPPVLADLDQIRQLILSLVTNALESLGSQGGEVTVSAGCHRFEAEALSASRLPAKASPGHFVWFEVSDTGCGMDAETQRCLFDPFFTTKFLGRGLGMSAVHGIVTALGGAILVESAVGQGSAIKVLIPVAE